MNKHTGTSMSKIYNTNNIKAIKCDCKSCYHAEVKKYKQDITVYCKYRDLINHKKELCARYVKVDRKKGKPKVLTYYCEICKKQIQIKGGKKGFSIHLLEIHKIHSIKEYQSLARKINAFNL